MRYLKKTFRFIVFTLGIIVIGVGFNNFSTEKSYEKNFSEIVYRQMKQFSKEVDISKLIDNNKIIENLIIYLVILTISN